MIEKDFYWKLREFQRGSPQPHLLKVKMDMESICLCREVINLIIRGIGDDAVLLDVGSGNRRLKEELGRAGFMGHYKDCDTETKYLHDYKSIEDINDKYDLVTMFDLIEHINVQETYKLLKYSCELLKPKGRIFISTPNAAHVNCIWKTDMFHIQQYPCNQLYGLLRIVGFKGPINIYRVHMMPDRGFLKNCIFDYFLVPIHKVLTKFLDVDFAQEILVIADKGSKE